MKIDLIKLIYDQVRFIEVHESIEIDLSKYNYPDIRKLENVQIDGFIRKDSNDDILVELNIKGTMTLADSRTLEDVLYDFETDIEEILGENDNIYQNRLDLEPIIWQNILLEVPISISKNTFPAYLKGEGWSLKE